MQLARDHEAVAAIVALAADDHDAIRLVILFEDELRDGRAGVLHQGERMDTKSLGGGAVDLAHFGSGGDLHARPVAESSIRRKPAGSPITMRWSPTWIASSGGGLKRI